ncbi:16S rRNA (cytosine1402-N4)-methyltransferase [Arcanobacterium wilhelmae]|uniref:Ribosomal RNA small subunit methyltransferase H n=1 Tax=Arcanobacterium wilhelmae TaxID=1803177 RepID=A0ABT9N970_9ACTO|nr:16S rRNA (cytosine(1402)-N(4))-methyltransferase RsmH [Arcanobacterium wilhelmae]MDP9800257.1 16S rRNA (cytosine1402-N4)-methyltransferase [Arcanobacterium wilhelmae]WFN89696.1 16S rRNA (cytosine(1402)-N(4))-methyltransferase RsmH [Arcanobacterium wilhelmae]
MAAADGNALHVPVLLETCVELLAPALTDGALLIDCTLGMGGHTEAFLSRFPNIRVAGIDRDPQAIELASERLAHFGDRFIPVRATYDAVGQVACEFGKDGLADAILMDLGVSSLQLDETERGFSYAHDAPLDMRMDASAHGTAADILASASAGEIAHILHRYGEEKFAKKIAARIVRQRETQPITRTGELVEIVRESIPAAARRTGGNPAKRTFQALRVAVNNELGVLEAAVPAAIEALRVGGRLAVESYQSLEDRIVKDAMRIGLVSSTPPGLPVELEDHKPFLVSLTRGAMKADKAEIARNPRSASVRLRAVERTAPTPQHIALNSGENK